MLGIGGFVYGAANSGWYITELNAVFLAIGLSTALLARFGPVETSRAFLDGAAQMAAPASITSYNVCYTKLLRVPHRVGLRYVTHGQQRHHDLLARRLVGEQRLQREHHAIEQKADDSDREHGDEDSRQRGRRAILV